MALLSQAPYKPKDFNLAGLNGISDTTLELHFGLYKGYVEQTNKLTEQLEQMADSGKATGTNPAYTEITRHLSFEYNGMILHEYYFGNLKSQASAQPSGDLKRALDDGFGSTEKFFADFKAIGGMRGVGWAILFQDPATGKLSNHWITLHEHGNPAGFKPLLVMDVWEHAYLLDYKPADKAKYMDAFIANIDWDAVDARFKAAAAKRPVAAAA
jgi:Fe-Mn family superoxide dismutase